MLMNFTCLFGVDQCISHAATIQVLQFPNFNFPPEVCGARVLMLDHSGNIHSVYREDRAFTGAYWYAKPSDETIPGACEILQ